MEQLIRLFYLINFFTSSITICFAPFGLFFSLKCLKTVHFNLRFLILTLGIVWCVLPIGGLLFILIIDAPENPPDLYQRIDYQIAKNICSVTGYAFRIIENLICFERLFATVYFTTYEKKKNFQLFTIFSVIFCFAITSSMSFAFNILGVSIIILYSFLFTVEGTNFILLQILRKQNRSLRMTNSNRALLTSKYQLIENIKSLNLLFPQATISFIISNATLVITICLRTFYNEFIASPFYYTYYNINVIIMSMYWIYHGWIKTKLQIFQNKIHDSEEIAAITVKTALGNTVKTHQTVDEHFNELNNLWN